MDKKLHNNKPYNENYINELREEFEFEFIYKQFVEIDGKTYHIEDWNGTIEDLLKKPGRHYIYEPCLPVIRGFIIE